MSQVKINLTINIPDGATVTIEADADEALAPDDGDRTTRALRWMEQHAPATHHRLHRQLLDRLHAEFGIVGSPPATGSRPYLNFYSEPRYGDSRVGALTLTSGRFYVVLNPTLVNEFPGTDPAEGRYLTCYIDSNETVDLAVRLMARAMQDRGWES